MTKPKLDPVLDALRKGRIECPHCGAGWPFTVKNAAALEPMFTRHLQEHYRISAQRAKEKTESTNGDG
jgi:hypothetical protein